MHNAIDTEALIEHMSVDRLLALVVAHEDVQRMAAELASDPDPTSAALPSSWFDTIAAPRSSTAPVVRKAA
jgi:hypothetical protein